MRAEQERDREREREKKKLNGTRNRCSWLHRVIVKMYVYTRERAVVGVCRQRERDLNACTDAS